MRRLLCGLPMLALLLLLLPATALAAEEPEVVYEVYAVEGATSGYAAALLSLDDGTMFVPDSTSVKWIDRLDTDGEAGDSVREFYRMLEEGTDNDGEADFLIDEAYFTPASYNSGDFAGVEKNINGVAYYAYPLPSCTFSAKDAQEAESKGATCRTFYSAAWFAFDRDHPEVFWLEGGNILLSTTPVSNGNGTYTANYWLTLMAPGAGFDIRDYSDANDTVYYNESSIKAGIETIHAAWAEIKGTEEYAAADSDYEKVKVFNHWLTMNCGYNTYVANKQNSSAPQSAWQCISALTKQYGATGPVCEAYSRAFKFLCDKENIPCVLVDGVAVNDAGGGDHMWNYVSVDKGETWYAVDVTWNDPTGGSNSSSVSGHENENYLMVGALTVNGSRNFITSHPVSNIPGGGRNYDFPDGPILADYGYIDSISISGLTAPIRGAQPDTDATVNIVPAETSAGEITWKTAGGVAVGDKFAPSTVYTATIPLHSVKGYAPTSATAITLEGYDAEQYSVEITDEGIAITFAATASERVTVTLDALPEGTQVLLIHHSTEGRMEGIYTGAINALGDWEFSLQTLPQSGTVKLLILNQDYVPVQGTIPLK